MVQSVSAASPFPEVAAQRVKISLTAHGFTIWPGPEPQTIPEFVIGFPLEFHPFAWDYLVLSCDGARVEIRPHYDMSTLDTFWIDGTGLVTCQALLGLFPFTIGSQPELLDGLCTTMAEAAKLMAPGPAGKVGAIVAHLQGLPKQPGSFPFDALGEQARPSTLRLRLAARFWKAKCERSLRRRR
jgi:hypothetical protein